MQESLVDPDYITQLVFDTWEQHESKFNTNMENRGLYEANWRELTKRDYVGPWENSANYHVPLTLKYIKAIHARLWQLFAKPSGFFAVNARQEFYREKENKVKEFMDFIWENYSNSLHGSRREMDRWLWDVVSGGDGYLKCYWKKEVREYRDVETVVDIEESLEFSPSSPTGVLNTTTSAREKDVTKREILETPQIRRCLREDIAMPIGQPDPQESEFVVNRVYMTDDDLKAKVAQGAFYKIAVEESLTSKENVFNQSRQSSSIKHERNVIDGVNNDAFYEDKHIIYEYYGPAYLAPVVDKSEFDQDVTESKVEIVAWIHKGTKLLLGWTYLSRISPSGIRPIFKSDFVSFPERTDGVGVSELTYDSNRYVDSLFNLRFDNGTLASIPMFAYRQTSNSLRNVNMRIQPGGGLAVDDVNDIKAFNFPFLANFGMQEEDKINGYTEGLLATSDIDLGRAPDKVGALRNATGANLLSTSSGIQLQIHFDRIAHCMSRLLQFLFRLCRERVPNTLYYRVMGENGEPIFGKVSRDDLKGEFDFNISVDILSQSETEKQQRAVLLIQTLINPAFTQTGVVTPGNMYNILDNFLKVNKFGRINDFITPPPDYQGPIVTPAERISRIIVGMIDGLDETVRLNENHQQAIDMYEKFKASDAYGLFTQPAQIQAIESLIQKHQQLMAAQQAGGNPNMAGTQLPREGMPAVGTPLGGGGEALQSPVGEANGPVV